MDANNRDGIADNERSGRWRECQPRCGGDMLVCG